MGTFLYYIPGSKAKPTAEKLAELGMTALTGCELSHCPRTDCEGVTLAAADSELTQGGEQARVQFNVNEQTWLEQAGGKWSLGWETAKPPKPVDLLRRDLSDLIDGFYPVKMADGHEYGICPHRMLPNKLAINEKGELERSPLPEFALLNRMAQKQWTDFQVDNGLTQKEDIENYQHASEGEQYKTVVAFLALRYRLGLAEVNALGLLTDVTMRTALEAIMDIPSFRQIGAALMAAQSSENGPNGPKKKQDAATDGG